ncbi:Cobyrinic acid ac-diamide synthase [Candidatus Desulfarcum epimagneticum]|uniref:Cobyrinic acid ac-diamide synthase n=1 Tax=uncultured Desulfobacteraceae bacterium TaxID=218296 RepID=A0A484HIV9_9BACT|nr:Cobyrinic acid ac-diamide synthase [uncultured Desulfobacteraceae bacterium]
MKEIVVLSGKGGTGKTSLTAALASIAENKVICDADVDAADLHLLAAPDFGRTTDFTGGGLAVIDPDRCSQCGLCRELCRFEAIDEDFRVDGISCEGCGVCVDLCPEKAIDFPIQTCGQWFVSDSRLGSMVHARLGIAQENSGKLAALVRKEARDLAEAKGMDFILTDGPPGVGCPVIACLGGASAVLIVAEPTVSGLHDMKRVAELARHFKVPAMACVNKFDLNPGQTEAIETFCRENSLGFLGKIPFDPVWTQSMVQGRTVMERPGDLNVKTVVRGIWDQIRTAFKNI